MSQENVEIVRRAIDTFVREGPNTSFEGLIAEDVQVRPAFEVTGGASFVGPEGFARFIGHWTEDFEDWRVEVDELLDVREAVVARMRQSARGKGSGAPVEVLFGVVFRFRDRQIARMEFFTTDADALKAVGLEG